MAQVGKDIVITLDPTDDIVFMGVKLTSRNAHDFPFTEAPQCSRVGLADPPFPGPGIFPFRDSCSLCGSPRIMPCYCVAGAAVRDAPTY